jgi:hypothetical protein
LTAGKSLENQKKKEEEEGLKASVHLFHLPNPGGHKRWSSSSLYF